MYICRALHNVSNPWGSYIIWAWGLRDFPKKQICCNGTEGSFGKVREVWQTEAPYRIFLYIRVRVRVMIVTQLLCTVFGSVLCKHVPGACVYQEYCIYSHEEYENSRRNGIVE